MIIQGQYLSDYVSYSLLKKLLDEGPKALLKRTDTTGYGARAGSIIDHCIFLSKDEFNKKYKVVIDDIPTGDTFKLANILVSNFKPNVLDNLKDESVVKKIISLVKKEKIYNRVKAYDTFVKKFNEKELTEFTKLLFESKKENKTIIHISELTFAKQCKQALFTNKRTKKYFINDNENIYQSVIKFKYLNEVFKCLLDMIVVDHKNKRIYPIDLKTGSPQPHEFKINFFKYRYYLQSAIYKMAAEKYNEKHYNGEYVVEDFKFVYLCRYDLENPIVYNVSDKWIQAGMKGFETQSGYKHKGIIELTKELSWHKNNKCFELPKEFYDKDEIDIKDDYIKVL